LHLLNNIGDNDSSSNIKKDEQTVKAMLETKLQSVFKDYSTTIFDFSKE
jgi:hypothetical protein